MKVIEFANFLKKQEFNFITGVPCSYFTGLIKRFSSDSYFTHVQAVREDIAVGLSVGAFLAGKLPVVYMQNSGLGYSLEAFASLHLIYHVPTLVLLSYRGPDDQNMEEHEIMGKHTIELLNLFHIRNTILNRNHTISTLSEIKQTLLSTKKPFFLLIKKDSFT
jgi:sulfopyruvate decarboxylase subunit alpha